MEVSQDMCTLRESHRELMLFNIEGLALRLCKLYSLSWERESYAIVFSLSGFFGMVLEVESVRLWFLMTC